jgi:GNAT superfamily N-acetyltransferase
MTSYDISDATPDELDFVFHSCKWSQRKSAEWRKTPTAAAFAVLNPRVNAMIDRSAVLVARSGRHILGWIAFDVEGEDLRIGYVYTRKEHRRRGVARELLRAALDASSGVTAIFFTTPTSRFADVADRYQLEYQESA